MPHADLADWRVRKETTNLEAMAGKLFKDAIDGKDAARQDLCDRLFGKVKDVAAESDDEAKRDILEKLSVDDLLGLVKDELKTA